MELPNSGLIFSSVGFRVIIPITFNAKLQVMKLKTYLKLPQLYTILTTYSYSVVNRVNSVYKLGKIDVFKPCVSVYF
ncbi:hypothetical protein GCM10009431_04820 [Gaetbulibacter jejuensis]|uniref:Uncharacterized protein n=1 Tax=Gaetbulibacter jejuensis TaxID=584607 RepID=A0ABN1JEW3_9FLAO